MRSTEVPVVPHWIEIFGPVLSVVRVLSYAAGVELINSGAFGNGTAIFTNDGGAARRFFTQLKAITSRWLDPSHGGINLGFPEND